MPARSPERRSPMGFRRSRLGCLPEAGLPARFWRGNRFGMSRLGLAELANKEQPPGSAVSKISKPGHNFPLKLRIASACGLRANRARLSPPDVCLCAKVLSGGRHIQAWTKARCARDEAAQEKERERELQTAGDEAPPQQRQRLVPQTRRAPSQGNQPTQRGPKPRRRMKITPRPSQKDTQRKRAITMHGGMSGKPRTKHGNQATDSELQNRHELTD